MMFAKTIFLSTFLSFLFLQTEGQVDSVLSKAIKHFNEREFYKAEKEFVMAIDEFESSNNLYKKIETEILLAETYLKTKNIKQLKNICERIEKEIESNKNEFGTLIARYLSVKASCLMQINNSEETAEIIDSIINFLTDHLQEPLSRSRLYKNLGDYHLSTALKYNLAVQMYDSALYYMDCEIRNPVDEFECHWGLGQALTRQKKYFQANLHLMRCEAMFDSIPQMFTVPISYVYSYKIEVLGALGFEVMALAYFQKLKDLYARLIDSTLVKSEMEQVHYNNFVGCINMSDFYFKRNKYKESVLFLSNAKKLTVDNSHLIQHVYNRLAILYNKTGDYHKALQNAEMLLKTQLLDDDIQNEGIAETYFILSEIEKNLENINEQKTFLIKSLGLNGQSGLLKIKTLTGLGTVCSHEGDYKKAIKYLDESIKMNLGDLEINSFYENYSPLQAVNNEYLFEALFEKGKAVSEIGKGLKDYQLYLDEVNALFEHGIGLMEKNLPYLESDVDIQNLLRKKREKIKEYIKFLTNAFLLTDNMYYIELAFINIERSKSISLHMNLVQNDEMILGNIPDYLKNLERFLKWEINRTTSALFLKNNKPSADQKYLIELGDSLVHLQNKMKNLVDFFKSNYPEYYRLKYNPLIVGVNEVKIGLRNNQALIEYYLIDDLLYSIFVSDDYFGFNTVSVDGIFYEQLASLKNKLENPEINFTEPNEFERFIFESHRMYSLLIKPFETHIEGKSLVIVPDNILMQLPFDVLLKSDKYSGKAHDYSLLPFLIKSNPIGYSYSASLYFADSRGDNKFRNVTAFAPVQFPDRSTSVLKSISGTENEVRAIAEIFPTRVFLKERATEQNFKNVLDDKSIIHLALHTIVDKNNPMLSKMVFHPDVNANGEDGSLYAYEIYNLKLSSPLIALSSCQSGYGASDFAEGYKSMAWGFKYAGVPSILMTLWAVPDNASASIMKGFYQGLKQKLNKDIALQTAKINYLKNCDPLKTHPYYWSSYNIIGDACSLEVTHTTSYKYIIFIISYILIFALFFYGVRKKKGK